MSMYMTDTFFPFVRNAIFKSCFLSEYGRVYLLSSKVTANYNDCSSIGCSLHGNVHQLCTNSNSTCKEVRSRLEPSIRWYYVLRRRKSREKKISSGCLLNHFLAWHKVNCMLSVFCIHRMNREEMDEIGEWMALFRRLFLSIAHERLSFLPRAFYSFPFFLTPWKFFERNLRFSRWQA